MTFSTWLVCVAVGITIILIGSYIAALLHKDM